MKLTLTHVITTALMIGTFLETGVVAGGGGSSENALLIINPRDRDSLYVGNHYKMTRDIPDANVIYLDSATPNYASFVENQITALLGTIENRDLADHIDYIIVAPGAPYRISASGYISDGCVAVRNFSISGAYTTAFMTDDIFGGLSSSARNHYARSTADPIGFDGNTTWLDGSPSDDPDARRYFIGAMLGYTGERGNTVPEIINMIDRSAAVDGAMPDGTFYFMETNDQARSGPRHNSFPSAVTNILAEGWNAEHLCCSPIPTGNHDCLGIMTGAASPAIDSGDFTILPGAFCDHLTSFAGYFGTDSQVKMSRWIVKGASGTWGTVEEPCNYPGKFPHAYTHVQYVRGLTLGEAVFRCVGYVPFQGLLYGDPLTRPFTHIPEVSVPDAPTDPVSGIITFNPEGTTTKPFTMVDAFDTYIDGKWHSTVSAGEAVNVDTIRYADGYHELRVVGRDDSPLNSAGSWMGELMIDNLGRSIELIVSGPATGDLATEFSFDVAADANGASVEEIRLTHNGRVIATVESDAETLVVHGRMLGSGVSTVQAEMLLSDGMVVRSDPATLDISPSDGAPTGITPVAFDCTLNALRGETMIVELPATDDDVNETLNYTLRSNPAQAFVHTADPALPYRILTVDENASGSDSFTFDVSDGSGTSNLATVTLIYDPCHFGDLQLEVGPLVAGEDGQFDVYCGYPFENTWLAYSLKGQGVTPVPALNITLDLRQPKQAGSAQVTDAEGHAAWTLPIPSGIAGRRVFLQAAQRSTVSEMQYTDVQ